MTAAPAVSWQFLRGLSHEMANAANGLGVGIELLRLLLDAGELEPARDALAQVVRGCERVSRLTHGLRELASAQALLQPAPVAAATLLERLAESARRLCQPSATNVSASWAAGDATAYCDAQAVEGVFGELVGNAIEAGATGIRLGATHDAGKLILTISDDGGGLTEDQRARLFMPFTRARNGKDHVALGLWRARQICVAQAVDLACLDTGPGSTTFAMRIPVAADG